MRDKFSEIKKKKSWEAIPPLEQNEVLHSAYVIPCLLRAPQPMEAPIVRLRTWNHLACASPTTKTLQSVQQDH